MINIDLTRIISSVIVIISTLILQGRRDILGIPCTITSLENILKKYNLGTITNIIVMIGIWIVFIYGISTTFIFYLMTLLHLM